MPAFSTLFLIFGVSQLYWAWRGYRLAAAHIRSRGRRWAVCGAFAAAWLAAFQFNLGALREAAAPVHMRLSDALLVAPFLWWFFSSLVSFLVVVALSIPLGIARAARVEIQSPARRKFLGRSVAVATGAPFVAGAYGLLYGRLNLQVTNQLIRLPRLPRAFDGFRICQLSDIHIGPFMPAEEIRKYAAIAGAQQADMVVLTGDFVTFDPRTAVDVVDALRGLRAPFGVYGSLGNHEAWAGIEAWITELFRQAGVRILRAANVPIASHGDSLNLIGVDFQSPRRFGPSPPVRFPLKNIESFVDRDRVNILLSHNPDTFDRAAELGIDLSLAGHTHGGQVSLEFIHPGISPSRLVTPYVAGWFQKPGGQLYVNRGIGTIFIPIRLGAPPEVTVYTLSKME